MAKHTIRSGVIQNIRRVNTVVDTVQVDAAIHMRVRWFSGPNGTGRELTPKVASTESSNSPNASTNPTGLQTFDIIGVTEGMASISATDPSTGVVTPPYPVQVTPLVIMSGIIERVS